MAEAVAAAEQAAEHLEAIAATTTPRKDTTAAKAWTTMCIPGNTDEDAAWFAYNRTSRTSCQCVNREDAIFTALRLNGATK